MESKKREDFLVTVFFICMLDLTTRENDGILGFPDCQLSNLHLHGDDVCWFNIIYLNNYWMDCHCHIGYKQSRSTEDES